MSSNTSSSSQFSGTSTRVHGDLLSDDKAIGYKFADGLTGVGVRDFAGFIGVEPDFTFATAYHGGREALLGA